MSKKEHLHSLIHALSQSEKRYFVMECSRQKNGVNYLGLFRAIEKQVHYDESAIRVEFAGETFLKQLHVTKNYLYKMLLKSLRNFHHRLSKNAELKDILRNLEILFNKELYDLCQQELKRAENLATRYELSNGLYEVYDWKRRLQQNQSPHDYAAFEATLQEQKQVVNQLHNQRDYHELIVRVSNSIMTYSPTPVENEEWLSDPKHALTEEAATMHYNALYFRYIQKNASQEALDTMQELIERMERFPHRIIENPALYAGSINNVISYYVYNRHYPQAREWINRAQTMYQRFKSKSENRTVLKHILRTYNIELEIYRDTDIESSNIEHIEKFVVEKTYKMPQDYLHSFRFQLAYIHFRRKNFKQALKWVNAILQSKYRSIRSDIQINARFLNLMIHLEMQNLFVLRYFVDSTRRYLKKWKTPEPYETVLLQFFSRISKAPLLEYQKEFKWLYDQLETLEKENKQALEERSDYISYKIWLEEKIA